MTVQPISVGWFFILQLLTLIFSSNSFFFFLSLPVASSGFSIYKIMSFMIRENFMFSFVIWVSFSCLVALTRTSSTKLNRYDESGQYLGSCQYSSTEDRGHSPKQCSKKFRKKDIWSSLFWPSPERSQEVTASSQLHGAIPGEGIMVKGCHKFSYWPLYVWLNTWNAGAMFLNFS